MKPWVWSIVGQKLLSIHRPIKLDNKLSAFKMQWSDRHRTDIPIPKLKRNWEELRDYLSRTSSQNSSANSKFQSLGVILCGPMLCPLSPLRRQIHSLWLLQPWRCPSSHSFFISSCLCPLQFEPAVFAGMKFSKILSLFCYYWYDMIMIAIKLGCIRPIWRKL